MLLPLVLVALPLLQVVKGLECYKYDSPIDRQLRVGDDTPTRNCTAGETMCMKSYHLTMAYENGTKVHKVSYHWGCAFFGKLLMQNARCGGVIEIGTGSVVKDADVAFYRRACLCCGDLCNNATMDDICDDEPKFTHHCYSADSMLATNDPKLPDLAAPIPCTATMSCLKYSNYAFDDTDMADYQWGCVSTPGNQCNWSSSVQDGSTFEKACTCCGEFCNGRQLDAIVASDASCDKNPTTTTSKPSDDSDNFSTTVIAILGASLGVALLVLVAVLVHTFRLRVALEKTKPDRLEMIRETTEQQQNQ